MRTIFIALLFALVAVLVSRTLIDLQLKPARLEAFIAIVLTSIILITYPTLSLYLLIISISFYDPRYYFAMLRLWLHQWIILASLLLYVGRYIYFRKKFVFHLLDLVLAILLSTYFISLANSPKIVLGIKWIIYFLTMVGGMVLLRMAVDTEKQLAGFIYFFIGCAAVMSFISYFHPTVGERVGALVLTNPNSLGNYLALALPTAVALLMHAGLPRSLKPWLLLGTLIIVGSIIMTMSRSSWVGATAGVLVLLLIKPKIKHLLIVFPCLALILMLPLVKARIFEDRADPGISYRQIKIDIALQMFRERPVLGFGPGGFQAMAHEAEEWGVTAHSAMENLYLQILAEGGILQALAFLVFIAVVTAEALTVWRSLAPGFLRAVVLGSLGAFWAALGIGLGESPFYFPMINWLIGIHLGIILKVKELSASRPGQ